MEGQLRELIRRKILDSIQAPIPALTRRDVRLPRVPGKAIAVVGVRRSGKTTFMWQLLGDRLARGAAREGLLFFSFEDERLARLDSSDLQLVVEEYYRLYPERRDRLRSAFFLDEIQTVPGWETFVRRLLDTERLDLFFSGSSARLLSREVASSMRGRAMEARVYPFSFREFLRHRGREPDRPPDRLPKADRSMVEKELRTYLSAGGFPEAVGSSAQDREALLRGYVDVTLLRDVVERHKVTQPTALRWMTRHLLANAAGAFSVHKFYGDLRSQGFAVAKDTLHAYLSHLEDAFLIRSVSVASESVRRRMVNPRRIYPVDPGLIPVFSPSGNPNTGHALETVVLLELERRDAEVSYVRTADGFEVDFLARFPGGRAELIQVCADPTASSGRELRALVEAAKEHPRASRHLVALESEIPPGLPAGVKFHAAADWLLG